MTEEQGIELPRVLRSLAQLADHFRNDRRDEGCAQDCDEAMEEITKLTAERDSYRQQAEINARTVREQALALQQVTLERDAMLERIAEMQRREYVKAQHDETGRLWHGPREEMPARFSEVP